MTRWILFDLMRLCSMFAIAHFHLYEILLYEDQLTIPVVNTLHGFFIPASYLIAFSGHTVIGQSAFLMGLSRFRPKRGLLLMLLLLLGIGSMALLEADEGLFYFEWDIYPFLLASFALIFVLQYSRVLLSSAAAVSFVALCFPVWEWINPASVAPLFRDAFVGQCLNPVRGSWPLIPWVALPVLFFALGRWIKESPSTQEYLRSGDRREILLWIPLIAASLPFLGGYSGGPVGANFYCFVLRRPPEIFWAHFVWIILLGRLAFLNSVNLKLQEWHLTRWLGKLCWCRNFGACYLVHLLWLIVFSQFATEARAYPLVMDFFFFALMPLTELVCQAGVLVLRRRFEIEDRPIKG